MADPGRPRVSQLLLCTLLTACGGGDSGTTTSGADADALPVLAVREEVRIGSVDDPDLGFSRIGGVSVDVDGNVYVLETQDDEVRVYDPGGAPLRVIGRKGAGPGEFRTAFRLGFKGDTLWVIDTGLNRVTMFSRDGVVLDEFPAGRTTGVLVEPAPGVLLLGELAGWLRSDGMLDMAWPPSMGMRVDAVPPDSISAPLLRFDRAGNVVDTVAHELLYFSPNERLEMGGRTLSVPGPPVDYPLRLRFEDDLFMIDRKAATGADDATFSLTHTRGTDTVYRRTFRYDPRGISTAWVDSLIQQRVEFATRDGQLQAGAAEAAIRGALDMPTYQSPISSVHRGKDGSLWIRREEDAPVARWMILEPDGTPRGQLELPRHARFLYASGDILYAEMRDDFDVPWLVRFTVEGQ